MDKTRACKAGEQLGKSIIEIINLMYQNKTALSFLEALCFELNIELDKRKQKQWVKEG